MIRRRSSTRLPSTVQLPLAVKVTGKPDVAVAVIGKGGSHGSVFQRSKGDGLLKLDLGGDREGTCDIGAGP